MERSLTVTSAKGLHGLAFPSLPPVIVCQGLQRVAAQVSTSPQAKAWQPPHPAAPSGPPPTPPGAAQPHFQDQLLRECGAPGEASPHHSVSPEPARHTGGLAAFSGSPLSRSGPQCWRSQSTWTHPHLHQHDHLCPGSGGRGEAAAWWPAKRLAVSKALYESHQCVSRKMGTRQRASLSHLGVRGRGRAVGPSGLWDPALWSASLPTSPSKGLCWSCPQAWKGAPRTNRRCSHSGPQAEPGWRPVWGCGPAMGIRG